MTDTTKCEACGLVTMRLRAAEALAREVEVLIERRIIDSRSPAGDALLDYRDSRPGTEAAERIANLERQLDRYQNPKCQHGRPAREPNGRGYDCGECDDNWAGALGA